MKPQLSHLSLQCNSIITAPQRSHAQVLASGLYRRAHATHPERHEVDAIAKKWWLSNCGADIRAFNP